MNILGATLVDLRFIYGVSIDTSSYLPMVTQLGYLLGSLVGWLYRWLNRQLVLTFFIALFGIATALFPHYPSFWVAIVAFTFSGIGGAAWDAGSSFWIVEMGPREMRAGFS